MKERCKDCADWDEEASYMGPNSNKTGMYECKSPLLLASYHAPEDGSPIFSRGILCENDEGWGLVTAPNFGCVNFKKKGT